MPWMTGPDGAKVDILPKHVERALKAGYSHDNNSATIVNEVTGLPMSVDVGDVGNVIGGRAQTPNERRAMEDEARKEREYGGLAGGIKTGLESFASSASLGTYDLLGNAIEGDSFGTRRREAKEVNPAWDLTGNIAGYVVPGSGLLGSAGKLAPSALAGRLGQRIVKSGAEKGFASQVGRSALGYGVEGGIIGLGEGVQELVLSEQPVTLERAVGSLGSKFLYGSVLGGGIGAAGKAAEKGLGRAKGMLDDAAERMRSGGGVADDLASLDRAGLREASRLARVELGEEVVTGLRAIDGTSDAFRVTAGADKKVLTDARKWVTKHLDDPKGLAENPNLVAKSLRKEEGILRKTLSDADATLSKLAKADDELIAKLSKQIDELPAGETMKLKGNDAALFGDLSGRRFTRKGVDIGADDLEEFRSLLQSGAASKMRRESIERLPAALDQNISLQGQIAGIKNGTATRLAEIQAAQDAFSAGGKKAGMLEQAAQGTVFGAVTSAASFLGPAAPLVGAKVSGKITDMIFKRVSKAGADASIRSAKALEAFLSTSKKAARVAPPLASKTLASVAFGVEPSKIANALAESPKKGLSGAYMKLEKDLRALTVRGPDGEIRMHPGAREGVSEQLAGVRAADPLAADMMETTAARRVTFLASKLPKRPDIPVIQLGPDNWRPSDMAMRQFARFVAAVEDPGQVEERLADGSVTPEDAEAIRTVYPEMFEDIKARIIESLPELQERLPYKRRLALSIFSGVAVDPAMDPRILRVLQGNFADEPGTEGGTKAPDAVAQFGSISKPDPTSAQERAG